jgi:hypothetical protein
MPNASAARFAFVSAALRGHGPFRPVVTTDGLGNAQLNGASYLVRYPRESDQKFARRNELAFYASPLAAACNRFIGYLSLRAPQREVPNPQFALVAENVDGKGTPLDVWLLEFASAAKAAGSRLLLVDMPSEVGRSQAEQLAGRRVPYWTAIEPELVTEYSIGDDGKFDFVEIAGTFTDTERRDCTWRFDRQGWSAKDKEGKELTAGTHPLGECPVLIFTEGGDFPHFGSFSAIADLSKRLFNLDSELDEILRSQTFSLLTMQVPDGSTDEQKLAAARIAGETVGTQNLVVHAGSTPAFIAPPDGPARVYLDRISQIEQRIDEVGLNVATVNQRESGLAMQMRFQAINAELARFAARMEDIERRAWELSRRWLGMQQVPTTAWPRDFNLADVEQELRILAEMQSGGMPAEVIAEQQRRIVGMQFLALDAARLDEITKAIDERLMEPKPTADNVIQLLPDKNAGLRTALEGFLKTAGAGGG